MGNGKCPPKADQPLAEKMEKGMIKIFNNNTFAFIGLCVALIVLFMFLLPKKTEVDKDLNNKYNVVAQLYKNPTSENLPVINKLENAIQDIKAASKWVFFSYWFILVIISTTLTGLMGTWLQYVFTSISFVKNKIIGEEEIIKVADRHAAMVVLAAALISAALIVNTILVLVFVIEI